jgi:hypothetical protein
VVAKLRADLGTIVKSNWTLWVPFQFINFRFVPGNLQVLAANVVALVWNVYMSFMAHKNSVDDDGGKGNVKGKGKGGKK